MFDVREVVGRPSLDTFYQVTFSFGKWQNWLESNDINRNAASSRRRSSGNDFMEKMSIMCAEAELPGTSFQTSLAVGHHQGIQEEFPNLRTFPPLNLTFYCDLDHVIIEVLESWMTYINPITGPKGYNKNPNAYGRFNYPEDYKETIHVTKFERDTFIRESRNASYQSNMTSYEFRNAWPIDLSSMRVAYGESNVLRCNVKLAYDRFFTSFNATDIQKQVVNTPNGIVNSKEQMASNTPPDGSYGINSKSTDDFSNNAEYQSTATTKRRRNIRGSGAKRR